MNIQDYEKITAPKKIAAKTLQEIFDQVVRVLYVQGVPCGKLEDVQLNLSSTPGVCDGILHEPAWVRTCISSVNTLNGGSLRSPFTIPLRTEDIKFLQLELGYNELQSLGIQTVTDYYNYWECWGDWAEGEKDPHDEYDCKPPVVITYENSKSFHVAKTYANTLNKVGIMDDGVIVLVELEQCHSSWWNMFCTHFYNFHEDKSHWLDYMKSDLAIRLDRVARDYGLDKKVTKFTRP